MLKRQSRFGPGPAVFFYDHEAADRFQRFELRGARCQLRIGVGLEFDENVFGMIVIPRSRLQNLPTNGHFFGPMRPAPVILFSPSCFFPVLKVIGQCNNLCL
jgi:hypothetical protein